MKAIVYEQFNPLIAVYSRFLEAEGFEVFVSKEVDKVWSAYLQEPPDLVVAKFEAISAHDAPSGMKLIEKMRYEADDWETPCLVIGFNIHRADEMQLAQWRPLAILRQPFMQAAFQTRIKDLFPDAPNN